MTKILKNNLATLNPAYMWAAFASLAGKIAVLCATAFGVANNRFYADACANARVGSFDDAVSFIPNRQYMLRT